MGSSFLFVEEVKEEKKIEEVKEQVAHKEEEKHMEISM